MPNTTIINKFTIERDTIHEILSLASRFTSSKLSTSPILQGIYLLFSKGELHIYSTNLNTYFHTSITIEEPIECETIIEGKKILEFLSFLSSGPIQIEISDSNILIKQGKNKGTFPILAKSEFPLPPTIEDDNNNVNADFLFSQLDHVLYTASKDETRAVLTGINIMNNDNELIFVSTDGFRLSVVKNNKSLDIPSMIIPADFLNEVIKSVKNVKGIMFSYSKKEHIIRFTVEKLEFYSRIIDGEFPPFQRVIPVEIKTTITLSRDELMKNIKLISVFARDLSHVIVLDFSSEGLSLYTKKEFNIENNAFQTIEIHGESQKVAFNYRFVLDFLNHAKNDSIVVEILRSDAPVVFKEKDNESYFHIIMPVRLDS